MSASNGALAQGFLAGFNTMEDHYRGDQRQALARDEMAYRQGADQRNFDYQQKRDAVGDSRYSEAMDMKRDDTAYSRERDAVGDKQWQAGHSLDAQRVALSARATDTNIMIAKRKQAMEEAQQRLAIAGQYVPAMIGMAQAGQPIPQEFYDATAGTPVDPSMFLDPGVRQASKRLGDFIQSGDIKQINAPENLDAANMLFKRELETETGQFNSVTGETILSKKIVGIDPRSAPGTAVLRLGVEYLDRDGKKKYREAPVTHGRTSNDDDLVLQMPIDKLVGHVSAMNQLHRAMESDPTILPNIERGYGDYLRNKPGTDITDAYQRDYLKAAADIEAQARKDLAALERKAAEGVMDPAAVQLAQEEIKDGRKAALQGLQQTYSQALGGKMLQADAPQDAGTSRNQQLEAAALDAAKASPASIPAIREKMKSKYGYTDQMLDAAGIR